MLTLRRAVSFLFVTSAMVCGCACSHQGGSTNDAKSTPAAVDSSQTKASAPTLTAAQSDLIKGRYLGTLIGQDRSNQGDLVIEINPIAGVAGAFSTTASINAQAATAQSWNAKLEVSSSSLHVKLISREISATANDKQNEFFTFFEIQDPSLKNPIKLKLNFVVDQGRLTATIADASGLASQMGLASAAPVSSQLSSSKSKAPAPVAPVISTVMTIDAMADTSTALPLVDAKKMKVPARAYFSGSTDFQNGTNKLVDVVIQEPDVDSGSALYALISTQGLSQRFVKAQFNYGADAIINFVPALLDSKSGQLNGLLNLQDSTTGGSGQIGINCIVRKKATLDCSHLSGQTRVAQTNLVSSMRATTTTLNAQQQATTAVAQVYKGLAQFDAGPPTAIDLNVSYDGTSLLQTVLGLLQPSIPHGKQLKVIFYVTGSVTGVAFPDVTWDEKAQTLTATTSFVLKDTRVNASLLCQGFNFGPVNSKFNCTYQNSLLGAPVTFRFPVN